MIITAIVRMGWHVRSLCRLQRARKEEVMVGVAIRIEVYDGQRAGWGILLVSSHLYSTQGASTLQTCPEGENNIERIGSKLRFLGHVWLLMLHLEERARENKVCG